jgi:fibronectin type 3 domain-containing protein/regulation of enolase protein 1 (concanavalin A-like superfamily)
MELYGNVEDGWPKEYLTSETGTNNWHSEDNGARFKSTQPNSEAFDRIMRAHIAVVDRTMQHASAFDDFGIFNDYLPKDDLSTLSVYPGVNGQDPRIKTYRRLALAYATHGAPLTYHYLNTSQLLDKKVYFRGVDTSAIPGQSGSNAVSNKLLLNFVNFESSPQTMTVQVTLPVTGAYHAERFGLGNTYAEAHSVMTLTAGPTVQITENLGPGESVQYILTPPKATKPYAPLNVDAEAEGSALAVRWSACANAIRYQVLRNSGGAATFKLVAEVMQPSYEDRQTEPGKKYAYGIVAVDSAGVSPESAVVTVTAGVPSPPLLVQPTPGDGSVSLAWDAVPGASKYQVSRSTKVFGPFSVVGQSPAPTFTDRNLTDGTIYYYQIRSANTAGLSGVAIAQGIPEAPLAPPTSLQAFPGDHRVTLHWTGVDRAMSYIVERSAAPDNKFVALPDLISSPDWVDVTTLNDVDYQYRIASRGVAVVGAFSPAISATPNADPVIAPWHQADIGIVGTPGTASLTKNPVGITLAGSGDNLWGTADSFHFLYQDLSGDGSLTAHIVSFDNTDPFATVGVMIRETLTAGSRMVAMGITPSHGCGFPHRDDTGAQCDFAGGPALRWVRIERKGSLITGYVSNDGQSWQKIGQVQSTMPPNTLIGLVACSHTHALDTAQLSDITLVK